MRGRGSKATCTPGCPRPSDAQTWPLPAPPTAVEVRAAWASRPPSTALGLSPSTCPPQRLILMAELQRRKSAYLAQR